MVFLIGDAGVARRGASPVLRSVSRGMRRWAAALPDSSVSVVFLGDNVYPVGVRDRNDPDFPTDSARLWSQLDVLATPAAVEGRVLGLFTPGNHDWGNMVGDDGRKRLANQEVMIAAARSQGLNVHLHPRQGQPGPEVRDLPRVRLIFIDTHWFLQERTRLWEEAFFDRVAQALADIQPGQHTVMVAHHPLRSAGPHGSLVPALRGSGLLYLFKRSGTLIQDLNSDHYRSFLNRLRGAFAQEGGPPTVFVGGHDHSLQVLEPTHPDDPDHILVSGAGSKITEVSGVAGLRAGLAHPGYMVLLAHRSGRLDLRIVAGPPAAQHCTSDDGDSAQALARCMEAGVPRFRTVYHETLVDGEGDF